MSNIVDIEIVVDVDRLMATTPNPSQDPEHPTMVGHNYAYMIAASHYVTSGQATGDLSISARSGDNIRWRMVSQSGNTHYSANLMNITHLSGNHIMSGTEGKLLKVREPFPGTTLGDIPLPPSGDHAFAAEKQYEYFVESNLVDEGYENYNVLFVVYEYDDGLQLKGYFGWDPRVTSR